MKVVAVSSTGRRLEEMETSRWWIDMWKGTMKKQVMAEMFGYVQYTTDEDMEYGSTFQQMCFATMKGTPPRICSEQVWDNFARAECKNAIRTRRYNTTATMRKKFNGE